MGRAKRGLFAGRHVQFGNQVSEDGGNKSRRMWKPNVQEKRLFSYILDRHVRVHVQILKTPYHKMDTELGLLWKAKIEKMYEEIGKKEIAFFTPEDEAKFEKGFKELKLDERDGRREFRRQLYGWSAEPKQTLEEAGAPRSSESEGGESGYGSSHSDHEQMVASG